MTKLELQQALRQLGVDPDDVSLDGGVNYNDRYCLDHRGSEWFIYYAERGEQMAVRGFATETEACEAFLEWIIQQLNLRKTTD